MISTRPETGRFFSHVHDRSARLSPSGNWQSGIDIGLLLGKTGDGLICRLIIYTIQNPINDSYLRLPLTTYPPFYPSADGNEHPRPYQHQLMIRIMPPHRLLGQLNKVGREGNIRVGGEPLWSAPHNARTIAAGEGLRFPNPFQYLLQIG